MSAAANVYLDGNFAPVHDELEVACGAASGAIPRDLSGSFLRNGPNTQFDPPDRALYHPFDGDGMIHRVAFADGAVRYANRWVRTEGFELERERGKPIWGGFRSLGKTEPPPEGPMKNLANTAFAWHAGRLLATWEAGSPYELGLPSLDTLGPFDWNGGWTEAVSAHPKVDQHTGELIVFSYAPMSETPVNYGVIDRHGKVVHKTGIALEGAPVMIHDMAITERYSLILDMPITFSIERVMNGGEAFDWDPDNGTRIGVLPRHGEGREVRWFDVDAGYIFHTFNAFEEGDEIVLEGCRASKTSILNETDVPMDETFGRWHQYRLNLSDGKAVERRVSETPLEFARINEAYLGRRTRFGYASRFDQASDVGLRFTAVLKVDREAETVECLEMEPGCYNQEFVFAPRTGGDGGEDDGYLVGLVHDQRDDTTACWILDARNLSAGPVATVAMPRRVPYGFHSHWVEGA